MWYIFHLIGVFLSRLSLSSLRPSSIMSQTCWTSFRVAMGIKDHSKPHQTSNFQWSLSKGGAKLSKDKNGFSIIILCIGKWENHLLEKLALANVGDYVSIVFTKSIQELLSDDIEHAFDSTSIVNVHGWTIKTNYYTTGVAVWMAYLYDDFSFENLSTFDPMVSLVMVFDINYLLDSSPIILSQKWCHYII